MDLKKIGKKLLFPPIWVMIILTFISAVTLVYIFVKGLEKSFVAYVFYVVAFYTLSVLCIFFSMVLPKKYKYIKAKIYGHPIGNRYMTDAVFRTHVSLYLSLGINLLYVGINILFFWFNGSMWFVVLAGYYMILSVIRFLLARYVVKTGIGKNRLGELKRTKLCSFILLTLNFVLSGTVLMILYRNKGFSYGGVLIYVVAGYTFYTTIHAIIDLVKFRKYNSPVMMITKIIALSKALVSLLALETAMFSQFGQEMNPDHKWFMIVLTGAGVSSIVVIMSVYMIVKSSKEIKRLKEK